MVNRRSVLAGTLAIGATTMISPRLAFAQAGGYRNVLFILLRGGADGLEMLAPSGDPGLTRLRPRWQAGFDGALPAGGDFMINPALAQIGGGYEAGETLFVHATATSYRERSHFDGQNMLETGGPQPYVTKDGWLNRLAGMLAPADAKALAITPTLPLALRGSAPASNYAPSALPEASEDFLKRVGNLYADDELLAGVWQAALETQEMAGDSDLRNLRDAKATGELAASLMKGPGGARIGMVELNGWDSHAGQVGRFRRLAGNLDGFVGAYRDGLGEAWDDTLVLVATEFGRTARMNGTNGTDHGTASAAIVMGGSVKGGRVIADWPGLRDGDLMGNRDLKPTTSLESVLAGAAAEHLGLDPELAMRTLFPGRDGRALGGLVRT
ncbi:MAG: DUF1501 domain-containing protein [Pseudomonadota bacterium]